MSDGLLSKCKADCCASALEARRNDDKLGLRARVTIQSSVSIQIFENVATEFISFSPFHDLRDHFAIKLGRDQPIGIPLVRIHSECVTGDVFSSARCDCGAQLKEAVQRVSEVGGYILYLRQEGRGIGLAAKFRAYKLQDEGLDTYEANEAIDMPSDNRCYGAAAAMLVALGVFRIRLLTNNPRKVSGMTTLGIDVAERVSTSVFKTEQNTRYIQAKRDKGGHLFDLS